MLVLSKTHHNLTCTRINALRQDSWSLHACACVGLHEATHLALAVLGQLAAIHAATKVNNDHLSRR